MKRSTENRKRGGFSLVELTVVILIMGILAAVAAPKLFNKMTEARANASRQSLAVVRSAIEAHLVDEGSYPADPSAVAFVDKYLKGAFPVCDAIKDGNADVSVASAGTKLAYSASATESWLYDSTTGEFRINDSAMVAW